MFVGRSPIAVTNSLWNRYEIFLLVAVITGYLVLVFYGSMEGVRGSDQYWYLADIKSLVTGVGVVSNNVYPVSLIPVEATLPRPFIHNVFYVYLSAIPGYFFGPFSGAIIVNSLSGLITALFIYLLVYRLTDHRISALVSGAVYLIFPLTYWLSINVLAEAAIAPLVMASVYIFVTAGSSWGKWLMGTIIMGLLLLSRESFLLLFILVPLTFLIQNRPVTLLKSTFAVVLFTFFLSFWWISKTVFEHNVSCSFAGMLNMGIPGISSNMDCFYNLDNQEIDVSLWLKKALFGLKKQFLSFDSFGVLFYWPANLMSAIAVYFIYKNYRGDVRLLSLYAVAIFALHLTTIVLVQNQFRYLGIIVCVGFVLLGVLIGLKMNQMSTKKWLMMTTTAIVFVCVTVDISFAQKVREQAVSDAATIYELSSLFNRHISKDSSLMVETDLSEFRDSIILGYSLEPRIALFVTDEYPADVYHTLLNKINAKWFVLKQQSPIKKRMQTHDLIKICDLPEPKFSGLSLFTIAEKSE